MKTLKQIIRQRDFFNDIEYELIEREIQECVREWLQQKQQLERKHNTIEWLLEELDQ